MSFKSILQAIFPFLFSALRREFDSRPEEDRMALINGSLFGQVLKDYSKQGYDAVVKAAFNVLGWPKETVDEVLMMLAQKKGVVIPSPERFIEWIHGQELFLLDNSAYDDFFSSLAGQVAIILSKEKLDWTVIAVGLLEFAYRHSVKGKI